MVKLVYVINGLSRGGAETMLLNLLEAIDRSRFSPVVVSLTTRGELGPRLEALGVPVHTLGLRPSGLNPLRFLRLVRLLRREKPALVHTWLYHSDLFGGLAARLAGTGKIVWGIRHADLSPTGNKRTTLGVARVCAALSSRLPSGILSCSLRAREAHAAFGYPAGKITVIPNGVDLRSFAPSPALRGAVRDELGIPPSAPLIGHVGRFHPLKNHLGFLEAARLIRRRRPDAHFLLAGAGVDMDNPELREAVSRAGLGENTQLLGLRADVPRLMAALDVLVSSSHGEAFPNVLVEAMACGVPCAATDVGDSADIVGDTGRVAAAGDMEGLAEGVVELLDLPRDDQRRLAEATRSRVENFYEIGAVVRRYEAYYRSLLSPGARPSREPGEARR